MKRLTHLLKSFHGLVEAAACLGIFFTLAGLLGRVYWVPELFTHYKPLLALCFILYAVIEFALRRKSIAVLSLLLALVNSWPVLHLRFSSIPQSTLNPGNPQCLRVLQANILTSNTNTTALLHLIDTEQPDVIMLQEPNKRWLNELAPLTNRYSVCAAMPREDIFGAAVLCKHPAVFARIVQLTISGGIPLTHARLTLNNRTLDLVGVHAYAPFNAAYWHKRNRFMQKLATHLQQLPTPLIVTGDFNNTPWSFHFRQFLSQSALIDSAQGRGHLATWPVSNQLLRLPLDHCLHTANVRILDRRCGPDIGSDHFPLVIDLAF